MSTTGIALIVPILFSQIDEPSTSVVDMVVVTTDATELARGDRVLATLMKGERLRIGAIRGVWLRTQVTREGKALSGWVNIRDVMIESDPRSRHFVPHDGRLPAPPDDASDSRWRQSLPEYTQVTERGEVVLGMDTALVLARIHSPAYQRQLETLYRSALNINTQRNSGRGPGTAGAEAADRKERAALAETHLRRNLDAFQRYRQGFYTWVAVGDLGVSELADSGGFDSRFGASFTAGGARQVGGFIGLLRQLQQIRNAKDNLSLQEWALARLEAYLNMGAMSLAQVDQFRQSIERERAHVLEIHSDFELSLDTYKTDTLGLPPDLPIKLDESLIHQFQLVASEATVIEESIHKLLDRAGELSGDARRLQADVSVDTIRQILTDTVQLVESVRNRLGNVKPDLARMDAVRPLRERTMSDEERELFQHERVRLRESLADLEEQFEAAKGKMKTLRNGLSEETKEATVDGSVDWLHGLLRIVQESTLVQARARLEAISVVTIELDSQGAFEIALANRMDLVTKGAALVDTRRSIAPSGSVERNKHRQSLIDGRRDRRDFIQCLDTVHRDLRQLLRRLGALRTNLEIQRRAVAISIRRVRIAQLQLDCPVPPPYAGRPAAQFGPNAALNLWSALNDLRNTQDNLVSVWLNHFATRMVLVRELGIMELDNNGMWIDPGPILDQPLGRPDNLEENPVAPVAPPIPDMAPPVPELPLPEPEPIPHPDETDG